RSALPPFPTRRSSDLLSAGASIRCATATVSMRASLSDEVRAGMRARIGLQIIDEAPQRPVAAGEHAAREADAVEDLDVLVDHRRSEEHTSELQSRENL